MAEQREKLRDDYRREVGDARRHWYWQGWVEWLKEQAARGDAGAVRWYRLAAEQSDAKVQFSRCYFPSGRRTALRRKLGF